MPQARQALKSVMSPFPALKNAIYCHCGGLDLSPRSA